VLWQVPVDAAAKDTVMNYFHQLTTAELAVDEPLTFEPKWTPVKRLHFVRDNMPEDARSSKAWLNTLPAPSEGAINATKRCKLMFAAQQSVGDWS